MVAVDSNRSVVSTVYNEIYSSGSVIRESDGYYFILTVDNIRTVFSHFKCAVFAYCKESFNGLVIVVCITSEDYSYIVSWVNSWFFNVELKDFVFFCCSCDCNYFTDLYTVNHNFDCTDSSTVNCYLNGFIVTIGNVWRVFRQFYIN